jgi:hypothetical protein
MISILRRSPEASLAKVHAALASTEGKLVELGRQRDEALTADDEVTDVATLDRSIAEHEGLAKIHRDRISALEAEVVKGGRAKLRRAYDAAIAAVQKELSKRAELAAEVDAAIQRLGDAYSELLRSRAAAVGAWPNDLSGLPLDALPEGDIHQEAGWALYAAGRPTWDKGCQLPSPNNAGLGVAGIEPKGVAGRVAEQHRILIAQLKRARDAA